MQSRLATRAALLLATAAAVAAGATATSAAGSLQVCRELHGRWHDHHGAAGTIVLSIALYNGGPRCTLKGYAKLKLANNAGSLPTRVLHGGLAVLNGRPRLVAVPRDGAATIFVAYGDVPVNGERCPLSTAVLVRPPGSPYTLRVAVRARVCDHGRLRESPVLSGLRAAP